MAAILPIIANTQQLKTPSEKDIVKTGGKSLFSLQLLHHGRPNDNSLRTPDKTVLCALVSPLYSTDDRAHASLQAPRDACQTSLIYGVI